jgi:ribonuclease P protein component
VTGGPLALPRDARLRKRPEFLEVQSRGRRVHTPHFILLLSPGPRQALGVTVTRKIAGAVGRNRIKRLCREVFRLNRALFPARCAIVAVARAGAAGLDYAAVVAEVTTASPALYRAAGVPESPAPLTDEPIKGSRASGESASSLAPTKRGKP